MTPDASKPDRPDALERCLLIGAFAAWIVNAVARWWLAVPLGHDEAQYALAAHDLLHGVSARWLYLSPGMNVVAVPGVLLGGTERALRILPLVIGTGFLGACWWFARTLTRARTATWLVAILAASVSLLRISSELLSDLPSAALVLVALGLAVRELDRDTGLTRRLHVVAPLLAVAFYVRYGASVAIAVFTVAWFVMLARRITAHARLVAITGALMIVCLVPYFVYSLHATGSLLGLFRISRATAAEDAGGIGGYLAVRMYGPLLLGAVIAGLVLPLGSARGWILRVAAVGIVIVTGLTGPAQLRYVVVPLVVLATLGIDAIGRLSLGAARRPLRLLIAAGIAVAWIVAVAGTAGYRRVREAGTVSTVRAAAAIRADAASKPCFVLGRHLTQLEWYSGCTATLEVPPTPGLVYLVADDTGGPGQPDLRPFPAARRVAGDAGFTVIEIR